MIVTGIEHFVLISTVLALAGFAAACLVRKLVLSGRWEAHPQVLSRFYAAMIVLPLVTAAWLVLAALLPLWWLSEPALDAAHPAPLHRFHMLGEMTAGLEPGLAYSTLVFLGVAILGAVVMNVRGYLHVTSAVERLRRREPTPPREHVVLLDAVGIPAELELTLLMTQYPLAFICGFRRAKLIVSSGLLFAVTRDGLRGVLQHERAHHMRRDNLTRALLCICSHASLAAPLSRRILRWHAEQVELVCDEVAAALTGGPLDIAEALVASRRTTQFHPGGWPWRRPMSAFPPSDAPSFEHRVRRLVAMADAVPNPASAAALMKGPRNMALAMTGISMMTFVVLTLWMPLGVHRAAEAVMRVVTW